MRTKTRTTRSVMGRSTLFVDGSILDRCVVTQAYRFAMGHKEADEDLRYINDLLDVFRVDYRFDSLVLGLVSDEAFLFRAEEAE